jgi:hypothetical protein
MTSWWLGEKRLESWPYPVNLIPVIRLQHDRRDNPPSRRRLHHHLYLAEENVLGALDQRRLVVLGDGEDGAIFLVDAERRVVS